MLFPIYHIAPLPFSFSLVWTRIPTCIVMIEDGFYCIFCSILLYRARELTLLALVDALLRSAWPDLHHLFSGPALLMPAMP